MSNTKLYTPASTILKNETFVPKWYIIDAKGQIVGRLATQIATVLMGKHRPDYTPHVNSGDYVVIINADKVEFSGNKMESEVHPNFTSKMKVKKYNRFTGYPSGLRQFSAEDFLIAGQGQRILSEGIRCMLPKTKLGRHMLKRLRLFNGPEHTHQAQNPEPLPEHIYKIRKA